jgi:dipeptidyl aminopeptidase/acylaminoacyl peptidase
LAAGVLALPIRGETSPVVQLLSRQFTHEVAVRCIALSPDGKLLASCAGDKRVHLWDIAAKKEVGAVPVQTADILAVAFAPDGKSLASGGGDKTLRLWQLDPVKELRRAELKDGTVEAVAFSADGTLIATGGSDHILRLWDADTLKELRALKGHEGVVTAVAFSPNGKMLVSGSKDRSVRLWDVESGKELRRFREHRGWVFAVAFSADGQSVASAGRDQAVILWDVFAERALLHLQDYGGSFFSVAFSSDGRVLAAGSKDHKLHFWDLATGKPLPSAEGHKDSVLSLSMDKDGKTLASASEDGVVLIWDASALPRSDKSSGELTPKDLARLWTQMVADDETAAYAAMKMCTAHPKEAVEYFRTRIAKALSADEARLTKLITDLDNDDFAIREKATEELLGGDELVLKALRKVLKEKTLALEAKRRLEQIVDTIENRPASEERRRRQTGLEVLERIGTSEAKQALAALAQGPTEADLTGEAKAALDRLAKRAAARP